MSQEFARWLFAVDGMHCASCGVLIDETVEELPGVRSSATDVRAGRTVVTVGEDAAIAAETIAKAITDAGYAARLDGSSPEPREGS